MSWFLTNLCSTLLLPPLSLLLLAALGWAVWHRHPRSARWLLGFALCPLWLLSTPYVAGALLHGLESKFSTVDTRQQKADAIVVLGGGTYFNAPEYGGDTVGRETLQRLRYAARLYLATGKPILVTGGTPLGNAHSEAEQMRQVLQQEFYVPVRWIEGASDNTLQNARLSRPLLQQAGITRIYLVTHAWHMPRAVQAFHAAGFDVVPAPTAFSTRFNTGLLTFLPNAVALLESETALHEWLGLLWYRFRT